MHEYYLMIMWMKFTYLIWNLCIETQTENNERQLPRRLSPYHWSSILSQYNASVGGRYVVRLPPTLLSHRVSPELAVGLRNPEEKEPRPLRWQALAAALDPIDTLPGRWIFVS